MNNQSYSVNDIGDNSAFNKTLSKTNDEDNHPYLAEFIISLVFIFVLGFLGVQKISQVAANPIANTLCKSGFLLPFVNCEVNSLLVSQTESQIQSPVKDKHMIIGMNQSDDAPSLRSQFAHTKNLSHALQKLKWNGGSEEDAARFLSIITALENGRQEESGIPSALSSILDDVWNSYPDLVATSHCLNCSHFYKNVLKPYFNEGSNNKERINQMAAGHPRFLQAIYQSGQLDLFDLKSIAKLQAELLTSKDADTARFIGDILLEDNDMEALRHWSSKGWNGSYAISDYHKLLKLPKKLIIESWERGVVKGADNAEITRYLVSTGYRPALRWLLWIHAGNLRYFDKRPYKEQRDRYSKLILSLHVDFPVESKDDLAGFYSKYWKDIVWDKGSTKWVLQQN